MKYLLIVIFFVQVAVFAQVKATDSLKALLARHPQEDTAAVRLMNLLADKYAIKKPDTALLYALKSQKIAEKIGDSSGIYDAWYVQGRAYLTLNQYKKALDFYYKSLPAREKSPNQEALRNIYNEIGVTYETLNNFPKALEFYLKALTVAEKDHNKYGIAFEMGNLGNIYSANEQYAKALEYYQKANTIAIEIQDKEGIIFGLHQLGYLYNATGKYQQALTCYRKAYEMCKSGDDQEAIFESLKGMGTAFCKLKQYLESEAYLSEALIIADKIPNKRLYENCLRQQAETYWASGKTNEAIATAEKAILLAKASKHYEVLYACDEILSEIYQKKGNFEKALLHFQRSENIKDSLFNLKRTRIIEGVLTNYELDKKQQEIASQKNEIYRQNLWNKYFATGLAGAGLILGLLGFVIWQSRRKNRQLQHQNREISQQKEEINAQNEKLYELNTTKDRLFSIISHDLRSPIAALQGTLYLLQMGMLTSEELEKVAKELNIKVNDVTNLLNNLLQWAKSQMEGIKVTPEPIDLHKLVAEVVSLLTPQAEAKNIRLETNTTTPAKAIADIQMVSLILRNLISNAIKFTPLGGKVYLTTENTPTQLLLSVVDTGVGISHENLSRLFSPLTHYTTRGTSQEMGTGLGLLLCRDFAEKNGGSLVAISDEGSGSTFILTLPLST